MLMDKEWLANYNDVHNLDTKWNLGVKLGNIEMPQQPTQEQLLPGPVS